MFLHVIMLYNDVCDFYFLRLALSLMLMMSFSYAEIHNRAKTVNFLSFPLSQLRLQKTRTA